MTPEAPTGAPTGGDPDERYERLARIASGGMGEVWRARDRVLGREVAVKVLRAEYADDATFRTRFEGEARHAAALHHPGIASVFDYGVSNGAPYLVMELVDGKPLSDLLSSGRPVDPDQARQLVAQAADALAVAHAAGVVHRDVKPANLLVTPDGRLKITDFGIARAVDAVPLTQTGQIVGTPHYLSPEQARGDAATSASDVYALGVVLFECLAGRRPFSADTPVATALAHLQQEVPPLPDTVPAPLAAVVRRALAKDPAQRYADGGQLATALREGDAAVPAGAATVVDRPTEDDHTRVLPPAAAAGVAGATRVTTVSDRPAPVSSPPERSRWPLYAGAALLLLLLLVVLLLTRPWDDGASSTSPTADPTPSARPSEKASQQQPTQEPEQPTTEAAPDTVEVNADDYVGRQAKDVEKDLEALGLKTSTQTVDNPGDQEAGVVSALSPTGTVEEGRTITLQAYGEPAPVETPTPPVSTDLPGGDGSGPGNGNGNGADQGNGQGNGKGN